MAEANDVQSPTFPPSTENTVERTRNVPHDPEAFVGDSICANEGAHRFYLRTMKDQIWITYCPDGWDTEEALASSRSFYARHRSYAPIRSDETGKYRSGHARLFKAVTGNYPDANSHKNWFGWAKQNRKAMFFSCTLNTPDGWRSDRCADQFEKENMNDILSPTQYDFLLKILQRADCKENRFRMWDESALTRFQAEYEQLTAADAKQDLRMALRKARKTVQFSDAEDLEVRVGKSRFFIAAIRGDLTTIVNSPELHQYVHAECSNGLTALEYAVINNEVAVVQALVDLNADLGHRSDTGVTVLMRAAAAQLKNINGIFQHGDDMALMEMLLDLCVDIEAKDENGATALHYALSDPHFGINPNLEVLVKRGADINAQKNDGNTCLHLAQKAVDVTEYLVKLGADFNVRNNKGETPLLLANPKTLEKFYSLGADLSAVDNEGRTVVHLSVDSLRKVDKIVELGGCDVGARDDEGRTAFLTAAEQFELPVMDRLVELGADVHATSKNGNTALHGLLSNKEIDDRLEIIEKQLKDSLSTLLELKVDVNALNAEGKTALKLAVENEFAADVQEMLRSFGAIYC